MTHALTNKIGTADWHWLRKFSLTSSQAHGSFVKAIVLFHDDPAWRRVAEYLYGPDWEQKLGIEKPDDETNDDSDRDNSEDDGVHTNARYIVYRFYLLFYLKYLVFFFN